MATGTQYIDGRIPGQRIATTIEDSTSATFTTTETELSTVVASVVAGRTYRVRANPSWRSSAAGDNVLGRIREDSASGTEMALGQLDIETANSTWGPMFLEGEFTAASTESKTFSLTGERNAGSGDVAMDADATRAMYFYVDYIRG